MNMTVNKNMSAENGAPMYLNAKDEIVRQIEKGALKPHDALPSERALADRLGISRMTARHALGEVERSGYAYRKGRKGRFVADQRLSYDVGTTLSFAARAQRDRLNVSIDVISTSTGGANPVLADKLNVDQGTMIHTYQRVFNVDGRPVIVERESVLAGLFPDLLEQDLSQPSTLLHEARYGVVGSQGRVTLRCREISRDDRLLLGKDAAPYGMEVELVVLNAQGDPFCYGHQWWCSDLAEFTLLATPD
jgi:GntR family transcriptional regulator